MEDNQENKDKSFTITKRALKFVKVLKKGSLPTSVTVCYDAFPGGLRTPTVVRGA